MFKEIRKGIAIALAGSVAYFSDLLRSYPGFKTEGERIGFYGSGTLVMILLLTLLALYYIEYRRSKGGSE